MNRKPTRTWQDPSTSSLETRQTDRYEKVILHAERNPDVIFYFDRLAAELERLFQLANRLLPHPRFSRRGPLPVHLGRGIACTHASSRR